MTNPQNFINESSQGYTKTLQDLIKSLGSDEYTRFLSNVFDLAMQKLPDYKTLLTSLQSSLTSHIKNANSIYSPQDAMSQLVDGLADSFSKAIYQIQNQKSAKNFNGISLFGIFGHGTTASTTTAMDFVQDLAKMMAKRLNLSSWALLRTSPQMQNGTQVFIPEDNRDAKDVARFVSSIYF
jgi:hypothetical protein